MKAQTNNLKKRDPADAFYGQGEAAFQAQLKYMGACDPRLQKIFSKTRARFIAEKNKTEASRA